MKVYKYRSTRTGTTLIRVFERGGTRVAKKRSRRRRWKPPNTPTPPARQVWRAVYPGERWPVGWRVEWAGFMRNCGGLTLWHRRLILLNYADCRRITCAVEILVHEFIHMRHRKLRHGMDFRRLENLARRKLGFEELKK
jgi:hypothetical protein